MSTSYPTLTLVLFLFGLSGWIAYHVFFHPLAKYPGPFWCKVSSIPSFYWTLKGNRHVWIWRCHQQYGDIFRSGPNALVFNTPSALREIYGPKANVVRSQFYKAWQRNEADISTFTTIDKHQHAHKRRTMAPIFSDKAVHAAEAFVIRHIERWFGLITEGAEKDWSEPRNMTDWSNSLVFDILGDLCFGKSFEIKEPGENPLKVVPEAMHEYLKFMYPLTHSPFMGLYMWLKPRGLDNILAKVTPPFIKLYYSFLENSVDARSEQEEIATKDSDSTRKDMFHYIFNIRDPDTNERIYPRAELISQANMLVIAGADTSSVTFSALMFYLTRNPRVYAKLADEVRSTFGSVDDIRGGTTLNSCRYLRACIDETLRMVPGVPSELQREVLPGGQMVDGHFIPQGSLVGSSTWSLGYNEDYYPDPYVYRPERWIVDEKNGVTEDDVARAQEAFFPFSYGAGGCLGKSLAILELTLVVSRLVYLTDFRTVLGNNLGGGEKSRGWGMTNRNQFQIRDWYISVREGPVVQFKKRHLAI